jgi:hypothetical protein
MGLLAMLGGSHFFGEPVLVFMPLGYVKMPQKVSKFVTTIILSF